MAIQQKKGFLIVANHLETLSVIVGAEGEIRTPTPVRALDPEPSASTSSATSAHLHV